MIRLASDGIAVPGEKTRKDGETIVWELNSGRSPLVLFSLVDEQNATIAGRAVHSIRTRN
jgi:hypothetical protein